jgi:hypothetical protein
MDIKYTAFIFVPIFFCGQALQLKQLAILDHLKDPTKSSDLFIN